MYYINSLDVDYSYGRITAQKSQDRNNQKVLSNNSTSN